MCRWATHFCFPHNLAPGRSNTPPAYVDINKVLPAAVSLSRRPLDKTFEHGGKRPDSSLRDPGGLRDRRPWVWAEARLSGRTAIWLLYKPLALLLMFLEKGGAFGGQADPLGVCLDTV